MQATGAARNPRLKIAVTRLRISTQPSLPPATYYRFATRAGITNRVVLAFCASPRIAAA
jgi:hypothetical protein